MFEGYLVIVSASFYLNEAWSSGEQGLNGLAANNNVNSTTPA